MDLFQGIEAALMEIGLPDMRHYIKQELAMQIQVKFALDDNEGEPVYYKPTGPLPKSLQPLQSPIKDKNDFDYHQEMKEQEAYAQEIDSGQKAFERRLLKDNSEETSE